MANYLKGIGDASQRINEVLPGFDARINHFILGYASGILKNEYYEFSASGIDRGVIVRAGMMQAYGFYGCTDTDTQINFIMPSTMQYLHLFAEIDLSIVPNRFEIKATTMSNSSAWTPRQDNLKTVTNGKLQFPLWQVTLTATSITLTDERVIISKPANAVTSEDFAVSGGIAGKFAEQEKSIVDMGNSKMPKWTLILSNKSYTMTRNGTGHTVYPLPSDITVNPGDLLFVNARITNYGNRSICGLVRVSPETVGWVTVSDGGNGIPYSCIDIMGVSVGVSANNTQLNCGGYCRTRIRGDGYDSDGHNITLYDADYTIDSIYKIYL